MIQHVGGDCLHVCVIFYPYDVEEKAIYGWGCCDLEKNKYHILHISSNAFSLEISVTLQSQFTYFDFSLNLFSGSGKEA